MTPLFPSAWMLFLMHGINLVLVFLILLSFWHIFVKMGQPGWKGIVPVYNIWILVKTMKKPVRWFWGFVLPVVPYMVLMVALSAQITFYAYQGLQPSVSTFVVYGLLILALVVTALVFQILVTHALSRSFGHGAGFTVGLLFLPVIFYAILAFGESEFRLPREEAVPEPGTESVGESEEELPVENQPSENLHK